MRQARNLDATTKKRQPLPFEGLQVLDISQGAAGPYCAHMLWQQGAQVTKVEPPAGDWSRGVGVLRDGISSLTIAMNGGKQGLCVDASTPAGQQIVRCLAERADVIIENFRPGVAARLGLDPKEWCERRPELIFVSISGYGTGGPYAGAPATDSVVQADAGLMFCNRGDDATPRKIRGVPGGHQRRPVLRAGRRCRTLSSKGDRSGRTHRNQSVRYLRSHVDLQLRGARPGTGA